MPDAAPNPPPPASDPAAPRASVRRVWIAGGLIALMALYGLYRGVVGIQAVQTPLLRAPLAGLTAPVEAAPATPLPHDDRWSTLSGPKVLPPAAPKAAPPAASDQAAGSASPDDQSAAADAADNTADNAAPASKPAAEGDDRDASAPPNDPAAGGL